MFLLDRVLERSPQDVYYPLLGLLFFFASFFVQIILHEAGHLVFGGLSGYRFVSFRIF
jgi:hypothetical protein